MLSLVEDVKYHPCITLDVVEVRDSLAVIGRGLLVTALDSI